VHARVNPNSKNVPLFAKIPTEPKILKADILKKKGYIQDLKLKIVKRKSMSIIPKFSSAELENLSPRKKAQMVSSPFQYKPNSENQENSNSQDLHLGKPKIEEAKKFEQNLGATYTFDRLENLSNLYIKGNCKFQEEYKCAQEKEPMGAELMLNHQIDNSGFGEPDESQEIIVEDADPKKRY